jgi:hypothetical protein
MWLFLQHSSSRLVGNAQNFRRKDCARRSKLSAVAFWAYPIETIGEAFYSVNPERPVFACGDLSNCKTNFPNRKPAHAFCRSPDRMIVFGAPTHRRRFVAVFPLLTLTVERVVTEGKNLACY